jgi:riboflavin kinase
LIKNTDSPLPDTQQYTIMKPEGPRDPIAGPDAGPETPFPIKLGGKVIKGFGRGSKEVCLFVASLGF